MKSYVIASAAKKKCNRQGFLSTILWKPLQEVVGRSYSMAGHECAGFLFAMDFFPNCDQNLATMDDSLLTQAL
jgi:hypothetical protein